ncbi:PEPxxWA-CTERM sorting domain-containing protein [Phenylobacterium sp.]|uniref:PEPxxWA-CTERM sorting domain-containing protein n=1 Tax=Phenylobacterium sp. TaxID=1871053 RepID=UPI003D299D7E
MSGNFVEQRHRRSAAWAGAAVVIAAALGTAAPADAAIVHYRFDATVVGNNGSFAAPRFTYFNLSDPGVSLDRVRLYGGPPWDYVINGVNGVVPIDPVGGGRTLLEGEERSFNPNNGCTPGITYGYSSFDAGDSASFVADPETAGCGNAVVDVQPWLDGTGAQLTLDAHFGGGVSLTGDDWILEAINPNVSLSVVANRRYRLTMTTTRTVDDPPPVGGVPEPGTWALLILGFATMGTALRRRTVAA